jgi:uncharacterized PurR-regulated membrane protein YhhQ (DUF165 family)
MYLFIIVNITCQIFGKMYTCEIIKSMIINNVVSIYLFNANIHTKGQYTLYKLMQ